MSLERLLSHEVPALNPNDSGNNALDMMEGNNFQHLPVVVEDKYVALVKENDILDWETPERPLTESEYLKYSPAISFDGHPYDVIRLAYDQNLSLVPIVDTDNKYLGSITRETLFNYVAETSGLDNPGGIIVLEIDPVDYRLYDIVRICESEDVSVINTQVHTNKQSGKIELTIKTNKKHLEALAATYERFGIKVIELYSEHADQDDMMDRYNLLMNFINM